MKTLGILTISLMILFYSCRKDSFISSPDANVNISADTLKFDTLFVSSGSTYQFIKITNDNDQKLRLSSLRLMGGAGSAYSINVDGVSGPQVTNVDINANDSIYVFVQVNINPNAANLPFIIRDSIQISYNGKNRIVQLEAWGRNAHFFRNKQITANENWINDLPYVILGSLVLNPNTTLTIDKGCRIYVHADAPILIDGTLKINGQKDTLDRVYFRGDRLDDPYKDFPAGWPGIFFRSGSKDNVLNYAILNNAYQALALQDLPPNANPKLIINECIIDNAYDAGIIALNSSISARNCLVSNCGKNIYLAKGGDYQFTHCTAASFSNSFIQHNDPVLLVSNFINVNNVPVPANLNASFRNCIFWGENGLVDNEVITAKNNSAVFNVTFTNVLWKVQTVPLGTVSNITNNQSPLFDSINTSKQFYSFRLKYPGSPALNTGFNAGIAIDLDGLSRPIGLPDLGCYEHR